MWLSEPVYAGSTITISVKFLASDGSSLDPKTAYWSLYRDGQIVNGRENVELTNPSSVVNITLSGDDLIGGTQMLYVKAYYGASDWPLVRWVFMNVLK